MVHPAKDSQTYRAIIGDNVRTLRERLQITQRELASRVGVSASYLHQIEKKGKMPTFILSMRLANALQCNPEDLLKHWSDDART
jgi:transcriptional regulator with XRE-family HTH domain